MEETHTPRDEETVSIGEAAELLGVHPGTLRRWDQRGLVKAKRSPTGQRRYLPSQLRKVMADEAPADAEQAS